jgi:hypothetical protein
VGFSVIESYYLSIGWMLRLGHPCCISKSFTWLVFKCNVVIIFAVNRPFWQLNSRWHPATELSSFFKTYLLGMVHYARVCIAGGVSGVLGGSKED